MSDMKLDLSEGVFKRIHVDKHRIRKNKPAWVIRTDAGYVVVPNFSGSIDFEAVWSIVPLFPDGPNNWFETTSEIVLEPEDQDTQIVFPVLIKAVDVPSGAPRS